MLLDTTATDEGVAQMVYEKLRTEFAEPEQVTEVSHPELRAGTTDPEPTAKARRKSSP